MKEKNFDPQSIRRAIKCCGSFQKLADKAGVSKVAVSNWVYGKKIPSAESCMKIEDATKGEVKRWEIRPDLKW